MYNHIFPKLNTHGFQNLLKICCLSCAGGLCSPAARAFPTLERRDVESQQSASELSVACARLDQLNIL